jgi:tetratricopeptide (TPR) repeat protein
MFFSRVADRLSAGARSDRERVERILAWTYLHVRPALWAAPDQVQFDDPYRTVKRGFGYCDQSAHVFCVLAREMGLDARIYFLRNAEGVSPHTVAQVLLDNRWVLVDTLAGRVPEAGHAPLTVDALRKNPALFEAAYEGVEDERLAISAEDFLRGYLPYGDELPWRRGRETILTVPQPAQPEHVWLYDEFREAAMDENWKRADDLYRQLRTLPLPQELARSLEYHAALAAYNAGQWRETIDRCRTALAAESPWRLSLYELSGMAYEQLGEVEEALRAYAAADLPSTAVRSLKLRTAS